jgi:nitrogen fixation NifU-like protein
MSDLRDLYQEVIIDHSRHPRNFREITAANHHANGFNRLCGDKLTLFAEVENEIIKDISFKGCGCAISTASASLMTEQLKGKTKVEAEKLFQHFHALMTAKEYIVELMPSLGKLTVLAGVREYPSRIKCATLAWHTLQAALNNSKEAISTEEADM